MKAEIPHVSGWLQNGFHRFLGHFLKRHFHAIGIESQSRCETLIDPSQPLIVYGNHPSWWDPLLAHFLNRKLFPDRQFYAPIDAEALQQYRVFGKLGFYGIELDQPKGAAAFLRQSVAILQAGETSIWLTPEGRFADARDHDAALMPGLAHLCTRIKSGCALPLAMEYVFWEERLPVCLVALGSPQFVEQHPDWKKDQWGEQLQHQLRSTQNRLKQLAIARRSQPFDNLLRGNAGAGWFYDFFRRLKFWHPQTKTRLQHGDQFE